MVICSLTDGLDLVIENGKYSLSWREDYGAPQSLKIKEIDRFIEALRYAREQLKIHEQEK